MATNNNIGREEEMSEGHRISDEDEEEYEEEGRGGGNVMNNGNNNNRLSDDEYFYIPFSSILFGKEKVGIKKRTLKIIIGVLLLMFFIWVFFIKKEPLSLFGGNISIGGLNRGEAVKSTFIPRVPIYKPGRESLFY